MTEFEKYIIMLWRDYINKTTCFDKKSKKREYNHRYYLAHKDRYKKTKNDNNNNERTNC